jgi:ribosomal protein S18 acetylase RimI-like enzyme
MRLHSQIPYAKFLKERLSMAHIIHSHMPEQVGKARSLFEQYAIGMGLGLGFQNFDDDLNNLPGEYVPPYGALLMAIERSVPVGCVGMRPMERSACEMKRLFVKPAHRGKGVGRQLVESIVAEAKLAGYQCMRLDTLPSMREAVALYQSVGFREIEPYCWNPIRGALYYELELERKRR